MQRCRPFSDYDSNKYIKTPFYLSATCLSVGNLSGCTIEYKLSTLKQVIDIWSNSK